MAITSGTPATRAGMAVINSDEGRGKPSAGHVAADAAERLDALFHRPRRATRGCPSASGSAGTPTRAMFLAARCDRAPHFERHHRRAIAQLVRRHLERRSQVVELLREADERRVAAAPHGLDDCRDPPLERAVRRPAARQHSVQRACVPGFDDLHCFHSRWGPTPARSYVDASPPVAVPRLGIAAGASLSSAAGATEHDLVERVLHDALGPGCFQLRDEIAHRPLFDDRVDRHPLVVAQRRDRRPLERRQQRQDRAEIGPPHVEHQADAAVRLDGRLQQQRDVLELVLLPRIARARSCSR